MHHHIFTGSYKSYSYINLLFAVVIGLVLAILPIYLKDSGYSNTQIGIVFSVFPLVVAIFVPFIGNIADKVGKKNIIVVAILAEIFALILYIISNSFASIILARLLDAVAATTLAIIILAKVEDTIRTKRGERSGYFLSIGQIGKIVAAPLSILIADFFFIQSPFFVSIAIMIFLFVSLFNKREFHFKRLHKKDFNYFENMKTFLSFRELKGMTIQGVAAHAAYIPLAIFLPLFIIEELNQPLTYVSYVLFLLALPLVFQFFFGRLSDKYSPNKIVMVGFLIKAIGIISIFFINDFSILLIAVTVIGIGSGLWNVSAWHLMSNIGEKIKHEGLIITSFLGLASLGAFVSALFSGIIIELYSFQVLALISGLTLFIALFFSWFYLRTREEDVDTNLTEPPPSTTNHSIVKYFFKSSSTEKAFKCKPASQ